MIPSWHLRSVRKSVVSELTTSRPTSTWSFTCVKCERNEALTSCLVCDGGLCRQCWDPMHQKVAILTVF